jgi:hypothetical protein
MLHPRFKTSDKHSLKKLKQNPKSLTHVMTSFIQYLEVLKMILGPKRLSTIRGKKVPCVITKSYFLKKT